MNQPCTKPSSVSYRDDAALPQDLKIRNVKLSDPDPYKVALKNDLLHLKLPFPWKLNRLLEDVETEGNEHIISWLPDNNAFKIYKTTEFAKEIMPLYFNQTRYKSFTRQLYIYGFTRITEGCHRGAFIHPSFKRGNKSLILSMRRKRVQDKPCEQVDSGYDYSTCNIGTFQPIAHAPTGNRMLSETLVNEKWSRIDNFISKFTKKGASSTSGETIGYDPSQARQQPAMQSENNKDWNSNRIEKPNTSYYASVFSTDPSTLPATSQQPSIFFPETRYGESRSLQQDSREVGPSSISTQALIGNMLNEIADWNPNCASNPGLSYCNATVSTETVTLPAAFQEQSSLFGEPQHDESVVLIQDSREPGSVWPTEDWVGSLVESFEDNSGCLRNLEPRSIEDMAMPYDEATFV